MLVLNILVAIGVVIIVLVAILIIYALIMRIDDYFQSKFSYNFIRTSFIMLIAAVLTIIGSYWCYRAMRSGDDVLNGLILMMIGGLIAFGLISYTIWKTNLIYTILITSLQIGIFPLLIVFCVVMAGLKILSFWFSPIAQPVYIVDKD